MSSADLKYLLCEVHHLKMQFLPNQKNLVSIKFLVQRAGRDTFAFTDIVKFKEEVLCQKLKVDYSSNNVKKLNPFLYSILLTQTYQCSSTTINVALKSFTFPLSFLNPTCYCNLSFMDDCLSY